MSDAVSPFFHMFSPYSGGKLYVGRENKGFIVTPRSDDAPEGWGKPLTGENGESLIPGTPGGPDASKFIGYRNNKGWGCRHTPGNQLFGNVSWLGPRKHPTNVNKGKWVLTFHGPNTRYFPSDKFTYGEDDTHNNVYCEGVCIAVAPFPVLGAALRKYNDPDTGQERFRIVVVCYNHQDVVYIREVSPAVGATADSFSDAFRNESMALYDKYAKPDGWRLLGYHSCDTSSQGSSRTVQGPRTPWFFDSTGTVAQCMREADITFNRGDKSVTQKGYVRYKITVGDEMSTLSVPDNTTGFTFVRKHKVEQLDDYSNLTKAPNLPGATLKMHYWHTYRLNVTVTGTGKYAIAVDYIDTVEHVVYAEMDIRRSSTEWIYVGCDAEYGQVGNQEQPFGDTYKAEQPDYIPSQGNGVTSLWVQVNDTLQLTVKGFKNFYLYRRLFGPKSEFQTGVASDDDPWLYFTYELVLKPHYLCVPRPHTVCGTNLIVQQLLDKFQYLGEQYHNSKSGDVDLVTLEPFMEKQLPKVAVSGGDMVGITCAWMYNDLRDYWMGGVTTQYTYTSIDGAYPEESTNPVAVEPSYEGSFYNTIHDCFSLWPKLEDTLQSVDNYREGQLAEDSLGNFVASIKYKNENDEDAYFNSLNDSEDQLGSLTSASGSLLKFYPLGEM